ncbi:unnamed protein product [Ascophyllum nodosum]
MADGNGHHRPAARHGGGVSGGVSGGGHFRDSVDERRDPGRSSGRGNGYNYGLDDRGSSRVVAEDGRERKRDGEGEWKRWRGDEGSPSPHHHGHRDRENGRRDGGRRRKASEERDVLQERGAVSRRREIFDRRSDGGGGLVSEGNGGKRLRRSRSRSRSFSRNRHRRRSRSRSRSVHKHKHSSKGGRYDRSDERIQFPRDNGRKGSRHQQRVSSSSRSREHARGGKDGDVYADRRESSRSPPRKRRYSHDREKEDAEAPRKDKTDSALVGGGRSGGAHSSQASAVAPARKGRLNERFDQGPGASSTPGSSAGVSARDKEVAAAVAAAASAAMAPTVGGTTGGTNVAHLLRQGNGQSRGVGSQDGGQAKDTWGSAETRQQEEPVSQKPQELANFGLSGKLARDQNTGNVYKGVVLKWQEPEEARPPTKKWRLYVFKGENAIGASASTLHIHRQSAYLVGRERRVADIVVEHPSCSKQHAVVQFRLLEKVDEKEGVTKRSVRCAVAVVAAPPYIMDLESTNGTMLNGTRLEPARYIELKEKDVVRFGQSTREYVLLHDKSSG